jgi:tetratricopeptide (TPR) repeat protein
VVHVVMTDHLIQRRPPSVSELLAERQEISQTPANAYHGQVKRYLLDSENPALAALYNAVAQVIDSSNLDQGIPQLEDAIQIQRPNQSSFSIELGDAKRHTGDLAGAIKDYQQALAIDPLSSRAQRRLGSTLGLAGQGSEGLIVLQKALEIEPENALLWYEKALIESETGKRDQAISDLRRALQIKPDFADAQNNLGIDLVQAGDTRAAETAFRAALTTNPYDAGTRANLGRLLAGRSDWKQAAFQLQKAVQLDAADANAHLAYSVVLAQMNRLPEAEKEAEAALKADPRSQQARDLLDQISAQKRR